MCLLVTVFLIELSFTLRKVPVWIITHPKYKYISIGAGQKWGRGEGGTWSVWSPQVISGFLPICATGFKTHSIPALDSINKVIDEFMALFRAWGLPLLIYFPNFCFCCYPNPLSLIEVLHPDFDLVAFQLRLRKTFLSLSTTFPYSSARGPRRVGTKWKRKKNKKEEIHHGCFLHCRL